MSDLVFTPVHEWTADGRVFEGGALHRVSKPSNALRQLVAAAEAAGVLVDCEGHDTDFVQSQEDGEAAYAAAQADGSWHEGNLIQAQLDAEAREEALAAIAAAESEE